MPARKDKQGIGWSIPLINSNIYYFVLKEPIQPLTSRERPQLSFFNRIAVALLPLRILSPADERCHLVMQRLCRSLVRIHHVSRFIKLIFNVLLQFRWNQ